MQATMFASRGRVIALASAVLVTLALGALVAFAGHGFCSQGDVEVTCPTDPIGPRGESVSDQFFFAHRQLGGTGSITVHMTSMTGIITYPPPNHDEIVPGLVPWAKAGIIVKDGLTQGSTYAALMMTGGNGVRMQYDYTHDIAGPRGGTPRWLRLTRSGDTITGLESTDGTHWTTVATVRLPGLPDTAQAGLFATSPGDLTLRPTGLGASAGELRFTQTTATFDNVTLTGAPVAPWSADAVGEMGRTDWERFDKAPGLVETNGVFTVTGSGDIGPVGANHPLPVETTLIGLTIALVIVIVVTARYRGRVLDVGVAGFLTGLAAAGATLIAVHRFPGVTFLPVSTLTELRVVLAAACLVAVVAVLAFAVRALTKRTWTAVLVTVSAIVIPYLLGILPLLPDGVSEWLLRLTPAAGFSVLQTVQEFPQVLVHYAPSTGYFPLPGWAGFAVLCGCTAALLALGRCRRRRGTRPPTPVTATSGAGTGSGLGSGRTG